MSIFRMAERLSGRWLDSQGFCGVRGFDEPQPERGPAIPPFSDENLKNLTLVIDGSPEVVCFA